MCRPQVALDHAPGDTPATVFLTVGGKKAAIGTLRKGKCDQFSVRAPLLSLSASHRPCCVQHVRV